VDGRALASIPSDDWRARLAYVPQRPYLFPGSVLENLRLGRPEAGLEEVREAAREAQALSFIEALPQGFSTPLGEAGQRVSSGQARRLALARAFLRQAKIVVLDEPTAELDPGTEDDLLPALRRLRTGATVLLIAHRLRSVRDADQVVVLREGRVEEHGTHDQLRAAGGRYAGLWSARTQRA
jgi:ABC-type multidrug transport system fused ATPase/permease subunit